MKTILESSKTINNDEKKIILKMHHTTIFCNLPPSFVSQRICCKEKLLCWTDHESPPPYLRISKELDNLYKPIEQKDTVCHWTKTTTWAYLNSSSYAYLPPILPDLSICPIPDGLQFLLEDQSGFDFWDLKGILFHFSLHLTPLFCFHVNQNWSLA